MPIFTITINIFLCKGDTKNTKQEKTPRMYSLRKLKHTAWYLNIWIQSDETSKVHIKFT